MASLSSRERVIRALNHQESDRIPIDFGGTSNSLIHVWAHQRLLEHLHLTGTDSRLQSVMTQAVIPDSRIQRMFGSDVVLLDPGKPDAWDLQIDPQTGEWLDEWGNRLYMPEGGFFYDWIDYPLKEGTVAELQRYPWPDPRDPGRYRGLKERVEDFYHNTDKAILVNNPFGIFEQALAMRGIEAALSDLANNLEYAEILADRLLEWQLIYWEEVLSRVGRYLQVVKVNDDLGWHGGTLMSPKVYRRVYKPRHRALVAYVKERTDAKIHLHSDGDIYPFLPDFIEIGIDALNPVEVTARDMESAKLKTEYGDKFTFWGGGCSNVVLTLGTSDDVAAEARQRIRDFAPGGGFVFASIHCIQANVPPENIMALFSTAREAGRYPIA